MPRFRQMAGILKLMHRKERIRNIGVIAHIDHGKTTMVDSLLVEAGLLPQQMVGAARALDFLEEEQRRGITIKTGNISFLHEFDGLDYLINLIDTPGHVDFSGKVAGAVRAIDGAVVVVDSVEEMMAQTEAVLRQALDERVRPVLFINKVDRLLTELKLSPREIQNKFQRMISDFNNIIDIYAEPEFQKKWRLDPAQETVVFGSALHRWGFTLESAKKKGLSFNNRAVVDAYEQGKPESLARAAPLHEAILDMVIKNVPDPVESQKYRVPRIWKGKLDSEVGRAMMKCDADGPVVMCITSAMMAQDNQLVLTGRVFSGSLKAGDSVYLVETGEKHDVKEVSLYMSAFRQAVDHIPAGNIAALAGLESARVGETLVDAGHSSMMVPFEKSTHVHEPVMTVGVEPRNPKDLTVVYEELNRLSMEDSNLMTSIDRETGQYLISGQGELHLEIALSFLKQRLGEVELNVSAPIVAYGESVVMKGRVVMSQTPNKRNRFWVQVEPADNMVSTLLQKHGGKFGLEKETWDIDERANVLVCSNVRVTNVKEVKGSIVEGFRWASRNGPLCEQPMRSVIVTLVDTQLAESLEQRGPAQIMRGFSRAVLGSFLTAKPVLLEPIYRIELSTPLQWLGACASIVARRRGKIEAADQKGSLAFIRGHIPVAQTLGLSSEIRSATSGRVFWQFIFDRWEKVPEKLSVDLIRRLREERGLPPDVPQPSVFADEV